MKRGTLLAGLISTGALAALALAAQPDAVPYPKGYRAWQHVKSMVIGAGHPLHTSFGGIHHIYANPAAMAGYRTGRFADGAVIVFDLLEANTADNATTEGARKVVGVMHRNARRYAQTRGWGFEGFAGDSTTQRVVADKAATACYGCHAPQATKNYLFSTYRP